MAAPLRTLREQAALLDLAHDAIIVRGEGDKVIFWNRGAEETYGWTPKEAMGQVPRELLKTRFPKPLAEIAEEVAESGRWEGELTHTRKDGQVIVVASRWAVQRDESGRQVGVLEINRDVTERRRAEEALRKSEQEFRTLAEVVPQIVWATRPDGWNIYFNQQWMDYTGLTLDESYGHGWNTPFHPDDKQRAWDAWQRATQHNETYLLECRLRRADGVYRWWLIHGAPMRGANGEIQKWFGTCTDIEELKQAEVALRESEERLRLLGDNLPDSAVYQYVHECDGSVRFVHISAGIERLNGVAVADVLRDAGTLHRQIPTEYIERLAEAEARSKRELSDFDMELPMRRPDGEVRWMRLHSRPRRLPNGRTVWDGVQTDITEAKRAEETLRKSEEKLRFISDRAQIGHWHWEITPDVLEWSPQCKRLFGIAEDEEMSYSRFLAALHPDDRDRADRAVHACLGGGGSTDYDIEYRTAWPDGTARWIHAKGSATFEGGQPVRMAGIAVDITERKQAEEALRESHERLKKVLEVETVGVMFWDLNTGCLVDANDTFLKLMGYSRSDLEARDLTWQKFTPPEYHEVSRAEVAKFMATGRVGPYEKEYFHKDGTRRWLLFAGSSLGNNACVEFCVDISTQKQAEEQIKAALAEKEVLLKEIHHRVKNNMQVISSLVALQADQLKDEAMREVLQDVTHRVRSMALVHEKLYQAHDLARVEFAEYTQSLLNYLWRAHGTTAARVRLALDLEPMPLSVNAAVPCGLILNELATNALKHAFRDRAGGEVVMSLHGGPDGRVCLRVRDNGVGLPAGLDWRQADSLGLRLVQMLAGQLHATVDVSHGEGTEFAVTFGDRRPEDRQV